MDQFKTNYLQNTTFMKKIIPVICILGLVIIFKLLTLNSSDIEYKDYQFHDGFIVYDDLTKVFFLEELESGNMIQLSFKNDSPSELNFDDFEYVEVMGYYDKDRNSLSVASLHASQEVVSFP